MKKQFLNMCIIAVFMVLAANVFGQSIAGKWKTTDENTGKTKSIVEIYMEGGKAYGKVTKIFPDPGKSPDPVCDECTDHRKGKKIVGMEIINALEQNGDEWAGNDAILDPENGTLYDCKIWLDKNNPNILNVRGYVAFFYRTQIWHRVN